MKTLRLVAILSLCSILTVACSKRRAKVECEDHNGFEDVMQKNAEFNKKREVIVDLAIQAEGDENKQALQEFAASKISPEELIKILNYEENPEAFELDGFVYDSEANKIVTNGARGKVDQTIIEQNCNSLSTKASGKAIKDPSVTKLLGEDAVVEQTTTKLPAYNTVNANPETAVQIKTTYSSPKGKVTIVRIVRWGEEQPTTEMVAASLIEDLLAMDGRDLIATGELAKAMNQAQAEARAQNEQNEKLKQRGINVSNVEAMVEIPVAVLDALARGAVADSQKQFAPRVNPDRSEEQADIDAAAKAAKDLDQQAAEVAAEARAAEPVPSDESGAADVAATAAVDVADETASDIEEQSDQPSIEELKSELSDAQSDLAKAQKMLAASGADVTESGITAVDGAAFEEAQAQAAKAQADIEAAEKRIKALEAQIAEREASSEESVESAE